MAIPTQKALDQRITWDFERSRGEWFYRYGRLGPDHYRQLLVNGKPASGLYPAQRISKDLYDRAQGPA